MAEPSPSPAAPRRMAREDRRRQIVGAASVVFADRGYHVASMDDIAQQAGVTKPVLYGHYDSKDALYLACLDQAARALLARFEAAVRPEATPEQRLWSGILSFFAFVEEHRTEWRMLHREAGRQGGPAAQGADQMRAAVAAGLAEIVRRGARARGEEDPGVEAQAIAHALVGAGEALASWWLEHPEVSRDAVAHRFMNLMWAGLREVSEGRRWTPPPA